MFAPHTLHAPAICLMLLVFTPMAEAQDVVATSFDQLRMLARLGDTITVTDTSGHEIRGKLANLTSGSLALTPNNLSFTESEIRRITRHDHANLGAGARWGFGIGAATGLALSAAFTRGCNYDCGPGAAFVAGATLVYAGLGTGVGVGVSALIQKERVIYSQRRGAATRVTVSPLVSPDRKGMSLSLGF